MEQKQAITVLDIIISLTKAIQSTSKEGKGDAYFYFDDGINRLWGAKYLLGQVLRQYRIEKDHFFVSVAANELWSKITNEEMDKYHYTMRVPVHHECELDLYKGAASSPFELGKLHKPNATFQYRQVFHDEHVIPIETIIKKLEEEKDLSYSNVQKILDNIYLCRMLKSENIELNKGNRNKRCWNVKETIEKIYKDIHGIEIVGWEEIKERI